MRAHPTAVIESGAKIADDVEIGPYAIISAKSEIGTGCKIASHAQLMGQVHLGKNCQVGPGAIIGADPQSLDFDPAVSSGVIAGADNVFREYVTIHRSLFEGKATEIGNNNFLMATSHLGHDVVMGDHNVIANNCLLAGHVTIGDRCFLGGGSVYHQFIRIGDLVMAQGLTGASQDIPPYVITADINQVMGLNVVGLRRAGLDRGARAGIKRAFDLFYTSGLNLTQALAAANEQSWDAPAARFVSFFQNGSQKGICLQFGRKRPKTTESQNDEF